MAANLNMLALDVGERRVGVALANSIARLSSPFKTLIHSDQTLDDIQRIIKEESIGILVIGLPRNLDGKETDQTQYVRKFSDGVQDLINIPMYFEDEALSSVRAKETLEESKKDYNKEDIDSLAACYILDDFMTNHPEVIDD